MVAPKPNSSTITKTGSFTSNPTPSSILDEFGLMKLRKSSLLAISNGVCSSGTLANMFTSALASDTSISNASSGSGSFRPVVHSLTPKVPSTSKVLIIMLGSGRRSVKLRLESKTGLRSNPTATLKST